MKSIIYCPLFINIPSEKMRPRNKLKRLIAITTSILAAAIIRVVIPAQGEIQIILN